MQYFSNVDSRNRKVVLYISHSAGLRGAELCLLDLVADLNKNLFLPVVVLPHSGPLKHKLEELNVAVEVIPSIRSWLTRRKSIQKILYFLAVIPFIFISVWRLKQIVARYKVDLIHTNSSVIIDGALVAQLSAIPHVWHAREVLVPETFYGFFLGSYITLSIIKQLSDRIIAASYGVKRTFCQKGNCSQVVVVYNGLELDAFEPSHPQNSIRSQFDIPDDALLVGEIGTVSAIKGYEDFVRAAVTVKKVIPNAIFIGVGGTTAKIDAAYEQKILTLIDEYNLQDSFNLIGCRNDIADIVSTLDLLVLPSRSEAFGRVLVEAMVAGKPVIGTNVGGIPEVIEDGVTGLLVPPRSPDALAQAIIKVLKDPDLARRMGAAGRERAKVCFSSKRHVAEIQQIYQELIQEKE